MRNINTGFLINIQLLAKLVKISIVCEVSTTRSAKTNSNFKNKRLNKFTNRNTVDESGTFNQ
jgi:hypothetical protein